MHITWIRICTCLRDYTQELLSPTTTATSNIIIRHGKVYIFVGIFMYFYQIRVVMMYRYMTGR